MSEPEPIDLVRQLDEALHGETWARSYSPKAVWEDLLVEVRECVAVRREVADILTRHRLDRVVVTDTRGRAWTPEP